MLKESDLKIGGKYLYWSPSRLCHIHVIYKGKRKVPSSMRGSVDSSTTEDILIFRDPLTLNEVWTYNLINIAIDDGWVERFINEKDDNEPIV